MLNQPIYTGKLISLRWRFEKGPKGVVRTERPKAEQIEQPGQVPPLVTQATFDLAHEQFRRNKAEAIRNNRHPEATLLRGGFVQCAECGTNLQAVTINGGPSPRWRYDCDRRHGWYSVACPRRCSISATILDRAVWQHVEALVTQPDIIEHELARLCREDPTTNDLAAIDRALSEVDQKRQRAARALTILDDDAADPVIAQLEALSKQKQQLQAERQAVLQQHANREAAQAQLADITAWCRQVG